MVFLGELAKGLLDFSRIGRFRNAENCIWIAHFRAHSGARPSCGAGAMSHLHIWGGTEADRKPDGRARLRRGRTPRPSSGRKPSSAVASALVRRLDLGDLPLAGFLGAGGAFEDLIRRLAIDIGMKGAAEVRSPRDRPRPRPMKCAFGTGFGIVPSDGRSGLFPHSAWLKAVLACCQSSPSSQPAAAVWRSCRSYRHHGDRESARPSAWRPNSRRGRSRRCRGRPGPRRPKRRAPEAPRSAACGRRASDAFRQKRPTLI